MRTFLTIFILGLLIAACGKNDGVIGIGGVSPYGGPVPQAPPPPGYPNGYGGYPGGYGGGYFNPQMPAGYPPQYAPFLPVDNYMRRTPGGNQYWNNMWTDWQYYSQYYGHNQYDFPAFWFDFCGSYQGTQFQPVYQYFDQSVYYWVEPTTTFSYSNYNSFWYYYQGMPYQDNLCSFCY